MICVPFCSLLMCHGLGLSHFFYLPSTLPCMVCFDNRMIQGFALGMIYIKVQLFFIFMFSKIILLVLLCVALHDSFPLVNFTFFTIFHC